MFLSLSIFYTASITYCFHKKNPILKKRSPLKTKQNNSRFLKSVFNSQQIHTNLYIHTKVNKIKKKCHTHKKTSHKIYFLSQAQARTQLYKLKLKLLF